MNLVKRFAVPLIFFAVFVGMRFYQRDDTRQETQALLVNACAADQACVSMVGQHFDTCFDDNYTSRRRYTDLNMDGLLGCVNTASGQEFFSLSN